MELNLCMGCMREKRVHGHCPYCGFDERMYQMYPRHLPLYTILNGKYLVGKVIGEGGFGITYVGYDLNLEMKVAIKEYYLNGYASREAGHSCRVSAMSGEKGEYYRIGQQRFLEEAKRLGKFWSLPGIVSVKDYFQENNTAYIVMEYIEGNTLKQVLEAAGGRLLPDQIFSVMRPIMDSLEAVHQAGLIHRDITPENIMVEPGGGGRLIDFGAAKDFLTSGENATSVILKPGYAPAEQYQSFGQLGPWTDVYGLCATMYRAITGKVPPEAMTRMQKDSLKKPSEFGILMGRQQEAALIKGLALSSQKRFQTVGQLKTAIFGADGGAGTGYQTSGYGHSDGSNSRNKSKVPIIIAGAAVFLTTCIAGAAWMGYSALKGMMETVPNVTSAAVLEVPSQNVLMSDSIKADADGNASVLGSEFRRNQILSITFLDSLEERGENWWDVSADHSESVLAWTEEQGGMYDLYIAGDGGVKANPFCYAMFSYYDSVEAIRFNHCFDTSEATDMCRMFDGCGKLTEVDAGQLDTSQVTDMSWMFNECSSLSQLDTGGFDTSQVTDLSYLFYKCSGLKSLDVSSFQTSAATSMTAMFYGCSGLTELHVNHFDTSQVTEMSGMFYECTGLQQLDLDGFDTSRVTDMSLMFGGCSSLTELNLESVATPAATDLSYMFFDCSSLEQINFPQLYVDSETDIEGMLTGTKWE